MSTHLKDLCSWRFIIKMPWKLMIVRSRDHSTEHWKCAHSTVWIIAIVHQCSFSGMGISETLFPKLFTEDVVLSYYSRLPIIQGDELRLVNAMCYSLFQLMKLQTRKPDKQAWFPTLRCFSWMFWKANHKSLQIFSAIKITVTCSTSFHSNGNFSICKALE